MDEVWLLINLGECGLSDQCRWYHALLVTDHLQARDAGADCADKSHGDGLVLSVACEEHDEKKTR
jgi:hypothetical protein